MGRLLRGEGKGGFYGFSIFGIFFRGFWRENWSFENKSLSFVKRVKLILL